METIISQVPSVKKSASTWGPFALPDTPLFQALDLGQIEATNPLQWCLSLAQSGEPFALDIQRLHGGVISPLIMEALTAQAITCMGTVELTSVQPLEAVGSIIVFDITPHIIRTEPAPLPRQNRKPRYADGDPPVPLLFLSKVSKVTTTKYHTCIQHMLVGNTIGRRVLSEHLTCIMAEMVGELTRAEVFFFLVKLQSFATGAYKMRFPEADILPAKGGIID